jgi:hypothetical protein
VTVYNYTREWLDRRENSGGFHHPSGHTNPAMRYSGRDQVGAGVRVGNFAAGEPVLRQISADERLPIEPSHAARLASGLSGPVRVADDTIYLGDSPSSPQIGDHRVRYRFANPDTLSVIGRQTGDGFAEYQTQAGDKLLMAAAGAAPADAMFKSALEANRILTWIIRAVGAVAMFLGWIMILRPLVIVADIVPLIGSILGAGAALVSGVLTLVLAPAVIALAWFWYRPVVSLAVVAIGLAAAFGLRTLAARRAAGRAIPAGA